MRKTRQTNTICRVENIIGEMRKCQKKMKTKTHATIVVLRLPKAKDILRKHIWTKICICAKIAGIHILNVTNAIKKSVWMILNFARSRWVKFFARFVGKNTTLPKFSLHKFLFVAP